MKEKLLNIAAVAAICVIWFASISIRDDMPALVLHGQAGIDGVNANSELTQDMFFVLGMLLSLSLWVFTANTWLKRKGINPRPFRTIMRWGGESLIPWYSYVGVSLVANVFLSKALLAFV